MVSGIQACAAIVLSNIALVHHWARFPEQNTPGSLIEALNDPNQFLGIEERYFTSKILSIFTTRELAKLSAVTSGRVNVTSVNPGKPMFLAHSNRLLIDLHRIMSIGFP
jgi:hypothetical protein